MTDSGSSLGMPVGISPHFRSPLYKSRIRPPAPWHGLSLCFLSCSYYYLQPVSFYSHNDFLWYPCLHRQVTRTNRNADQTSHSAVLHRDTRFVPKKAVGGKGSYLFLEDGQKFLDSTGGAGVSCLGHGHDEINKAVACQINQLSYCHSAFFGTQVFEDLASFLVDSTGGKLSKLFVVSSGLSAIESLPLLANSHRLRSSRSRAQTGPPVFLGAPKPPAPTHQIHRSLALLPRHDSRRLIRWWPCAPQTAVRASSHTEHVACIALQRIPGQGRRRVRCRLRRTSCRRTRC